MILDPERGIMDVSYASAWELGRLIALSSPAFVKGLRLFVERQHNASDFANEIESFVESHRSSFKDPISGAHQNPSTNRITIADDLVEWIARLGPAVSGAVPLPRSASVTTCHRIAALLSPR